MAAVPVREQIWFLVLKSSLLAPHTRPFNTHCGRSLPLSTTRSCSVLCRSILAFSAAELWSVSSYLKCHKKRLLKCFSLSTTNYLKEPVHAITLKYTKNIQYSTLLLIHIYYSLRARNSTGWRLFLFCWELST